MANKTPRERIQNLKAKLKAGNLTAAEQKQITDKISLLGGKVNLANFPKPTDTAPPPKEDPKDPVIDKPKPDVQRPITPLAGSIPDKLPFTQDSHLGQAKDIISGGESLGKSVIKETGLEGEFLGRIDPGTAGIEDAVSRIRANADQVGQMSPLEQEAINTARAALPGLDSQQNEALRSMAAENLNRESATQLAILERMQGAGVRPEQAAAQAANLGRARMGEERKLNRDLLVQNIQQQNLARQGFLDLVTGRADAQNARTSQANQALVSAEAGLAGVNSDTQKFNTGLVGQETAARSSALLGSIGTFGGLVGDLRGEDIAKQAEEAARILKEKEIEASKTIANKAIDAQERIANQLRGTLG